MPILLERLTSVTQVEKIHGVQHVEAMAGAAGFLGNLQQTAGVGGDDDARRRAENVVELAAATKHMGVVGC